MDSAGTVGTMDSAGTAGVARFGGVVGGVVGARRPLERDTLPVTPE